MSKRLLKQLTKEEISAAHPKNPFSRPTRITFKNRGTKSITRSSQRR